MELFVVFFNYRKDQIFPDSIVFEETPRYSQGEIDHVRFFFFFDEAHCQHDPKRRDGTDLKQP